MADDKFKLPQSSYEELTKIVRAYGHFGEPVELNEVSRFISLHPSVISRNAGFLTSVGILQPGARKAPTPAGRELARSLEHDIKDAIQQSWRTVIEENDFLTKILAAIRIRNGMDQVTLESHVAYSAGQPKKPQYMTGARTVIDILLAANAITEADGKFVAAAPYEAEPTGGHYGGGLTIPSTRGSYTVVATANVPPRSITPSIDRIATHQLSINININCTPENLDELVPKLRAAIRSLLEDSNGDDKAE